eukprot:10223547-Ditylum_brightwellii.AAC.1
MHKFESNGEEENPDELASVGWNNGDVNQLKEMVKEEFAEQCIRCKNMKCKQSAKQSGVEQMCDVCIIFKLLKQIERETTLRNILYDSLSSVIDNIFKSYQMEDKLYTKQNKYHILKDFLAHLP